ncbi:MAG: rod-binding protein [Deltaproteobacteria bacterium]
MKIDNNVPTVKTNTATDPSLSVEESRNNKFESIIKNKLSDKDQKKLYEACQELEAVWLSKVMETMRNSIDRSDFIPRSFADETFESMLYDEYAKSMSKTGQIGIAEMLYKQLTNPGIKPDPNTEEE